MLGRGVGRAAAADPAGLFAGLDTVLASADLTAANLESPLTRRPHLRAFGPNALEAPPASALLLARAGFDAIAIANNHAGDAGPGTVPDTLTALARAGLVAVGGGTSAAGATAPRVFRIGRLRVALLAFDATGEGPAARPATPGVAAWSAAGARLAVAEARREADIVAVGLQGGTEYVPGTDPYLMHLSRMLARFGADVVWGQGPHVVQPVHVLADTHDGRPTVVITSLGNLAFDQHAPGTRTGALLEVVADVHGVLAFRAGSTRAVVPLRFLGWRPPRGDAIALHDGWWTLARPVRPAARTEPRTLAGFPGRVLDAAVGDAEGNGGRQVVVAFRRPFRPTRITPLVGKGTLVDRNGLTAHVGLYEPGSLRPLWVAGTLLQPVARVAACDGAVAVAYSRLNDAVVTGTGAWRWGGFGFLSLPELPGPGVPACADVDGTLLPVVLHRRFS